MATTQSGPFKPQGTSKTSQVGPWGGNTRYIQPPTPSKAFTKVPPFSGHSQKVNIKPAIKQ